jgi:(2Fe-2S) ferredoxin
MPKFASHIFVCCNTRQPGHSRGCCNADGNGTLRECFKQELQRRNLASQVRANQSGCLDQCELGPTVVIYPQGIWYGHVTLDDVPRIVEETIQRGRVLNDLLIPDEQLNAHKLKER